MLTPNLKNSNSANNTEPENGWDDVTIITDNRSGQTSRATSEGGHPGIRLPNTILTSEGGPDQNVKEQEAITQRKNKVREKWKRKIINRFKAKQKKAQDKRN